MDCEDTGAVPDVSTPIGEYWWQGDLPDRNIEAKLIAANITNYPEIEQLVAIVALMQLWAPILRDDKEIQKSGFEQPEISALYNAVRTRQARNEQQFG